MSNPSEVLAEILEYARWAPSGDNMQCWRFEVVDAHRFIIHAYDTRDHCVYDLDGRPSQIALGALLETIAIAASSRSMRAEFKRQLESPEERPDYAVELIPDTQIKPDPLLEQIKNRSVQRRPLHRTALTSQQKQALQDSVENFYTLNWYEGSERWHMARLMYDNAKLRLTLPEAYLVHKDIIKWDARFSEDKVPDQALGIDNMTLKLMKWVMTSWQRVDFFNKYLLGHVVPRIEMDLLPGLCCAAHFAIQADQVPETIDDYVRGGRAVQRFWLTATSLGLQLQPEMTPLIFSRYVRQGTVFSQLPGAVDTATALAGRLSKILQPASTDKVLFLGRIGNGKVADSRSMRLPVEKLMKSTGQ